MVALGLALSTASTIAAAIAVYIAYRALQVSQRLFDDEHHERLRVERRERMRDLHELYDAMAGVQNAAEGLDFMRLSARQQWVKTLLTVTETSEELPAVVRLSDSLILDRDPLPFVKLIDEARGEILARLSVEAMKAALERRALIAGT